jgi:hypothetical protein
MVSLDIVPYAEFDTECGTADPFDSGGQDRAASAQDDNLS